MQKAAFSHWPAAWRGREEHDDRAFEEEAVNCHSKGQYLRGSEQDVNDGRWCEDGKREEGMGEDGGDEGEDGERGGMEGRHQRAGGGEERTILAWIRTSSTAKKNNIIIKLQTILPYFNMFSFFVSA